MTPERCAELRRATEAPLNACFGRCTVVELLDALDEAEKRADRFREDRDVARGSIHMACDQLGGRVDGQPTNSTNFLVRIDNLKQIIREQVTLNAAQGRETLRVAGERNKAKEDARALRVLLDEAEAEVRRLQLDFCDCGCGGRHG